MDLATAGTGFRLRDIATAIGPRWPLMAGLLVLAIPTVMALARSSWSGDLGSHGPLVMATGLWLLWHCRDEMCARRTPARNHLLAAFLVTTLAIYLVGQIFDFLSVQGWGLLGVGTVLLYRIYGSGGLRVAALPLAYLAFAVPPPGWVIDYLTFPLQQAISQAVAMFLAAIGYPVAHQGVAIFIGTYQLMVENACSGMNSIVGLTALTIFYIYTLHRASWRYALVLVFMIVPIAMLVNLLRVLGLVLLTYHQGDATAQGFMHLTTGMILFACGLGLIFLIDKVFQRIIRRQESVT